MKKINGKEVVTCGELIKMLMQFRPDTPVYIVNPPRRILANFPHSTIKEILPESGDAQIILHGE